MGSETNAQKCSLSINDCIDFDFYKALFDPVRSEIVVYLASHGEKNIKEIAENFSQHRSVISRHLDLLYRYGILDKTTVDRNTYYESNNSLIFDNFEKTVQGLKELLAVKNK